MVYCLFSTSGELQSILCAAYVRDDITYTGTLSGDVYQWKGHTLQSVIKGAHNVSDENVGHFVPLFIRLHNHRVPFSR